MAQHFLLSAQAKTLTLATVFRMTDAEAEAMFCKVRCFPDACNCGPTGYVAGRVCDNKFFLDKVSG